MIPLMVFWNIDGDTDSPNGKKLYANNPKGVVMVVKAFEFSLSGSCKQVLQVYLGENFSVIHFVEHILRLFSRTVLLKQCPV